MRNILSFLATSVLLSPAAAALPQYRINDLAVPVETFPSSIDINDYGQIVGSTFGGAPFLWTPSTPGGVTGSYTPLEIPFGISHFATGINERGQIVGATNSPSPAVAYLWQPPTPNATPGAPIPLSPFSGFARGINESGQVSGTTIIGGLGSGFLFKPQTLNGGAGTVVNPIVGGQVCDINDRGQLTGTNSQGVVLWQPTAPNSTTGALIPIGVSSSTSNPIKINTSGQIAGEGGSTGAFLWRPSIANGTTGAVTPIPRFLDLNVVEVQDFNDAGIVLGTSYGGDPFAFRPWLWSITDGLVDINQLLLPQDIADGWRIERSGAINNNGDIVALATLMPPGGTPVAKTVLLTAVPEPAGIVELVLTVPLIRRRTTRSK